jgi:hypothetical protein
MPVGFEVFNANGVKVVDNQSPCLALAQKTAVTSWTGTFGDLNSVQTISVSYAGSANSTPVPVVYANPSIHSNGVIGIINSSRSGNTWTYLLGIAYPEGTTPPSPNGSVFLLIYDRPLVVPGSSGRGIEVYDAAGLLIFAGPISPTNGAHLKPVGLAGTTLPSGPKYAAIGSYLRIENIYDYSQNTDQTWTLSIRENVEGCSIQSTNIQATGSILTASFINLNSGGGSSFSSFYGILQDPVAADVTGTV